MLEVVQDAGAIENAVTALRHALIEQKECDMEVTVGHQGGTFIANVYGLLNLNYWFAHSDPEVGTRYWNGFGTDWPLSAKTLSIDVEINFPKEHLNRRVAGAFALDRRSGETFIVHRGNIGGGRKGVSKSAFWRHFRGSRITVVDGDREAEVALIGALSSSRLARQIEDFVDEVRRMKFEVTRSTPLHTAAATTTTEVVHPAGGGIDSEPAFHEEFSGRKRFELCAAITARCDHGSIVNRLAHRLRTAGHRVGNDQYRDLFIVGPSKSCLFLFEIKTDCSPYSVYTALGQLMLHGRAGTRAERLVLVVPADLPDVIRERIEELDVSILFYGWNGDEPEFYALDRVLAKP